MLVKAKVTYSSVNFLKINVLHLIIRANIERERRDKRVDVRELFFFWEKLKIKLSVRRTTVLCLCDVIE